MRDKMETDKVYFAADVAFYVSAFRFIEIF